MMKTCWNKTTSGLKLMAGSIVLTICSFFIVIVTIVKLHRTNTVCGEVLMTTANELRSRVSRKVHARF